MVTLLISQSLHAADQTLCKIQPGKVSRMWCLKQVGKLRGYSSCENCPPFPPFKDSTKWPGSEQYYEHLVPQARLKAAQPACELLSHKSITADSCLQISVLLHSYSTQNVTAKTILVTSFIMSRLDVGEWIPGLPFLSHVIFLNH